jgi:hypothetical protein
MKWFGFLLVFENDWRTSKADEKADEESGRFMPDSRKGSDWLFITIFIDILSSKLALSNRTQLNKIEGNYDIRNVVPIKIYMWGCHYLRVQVELR